MGQRQGGREGEGVGIRDEGMKGRVRGRTKE